MEKYTRRVRGNSTPPPDEELPIKYWAPDEIEERDDSKEDVIDFLLAFAIILAFLVLFMFAFTRLS
jgi:hypothetical protein